MSNETANQIVALLLSAMEAQARKHLPSYVCESWLDALSDIIEKGLHDAFSAIIEGQTVRLVADEAEIIDRRGPDAA